MYPAAQSPEHVATVSPVELPYLPTGQLVHVPMPRVLYLPVPQMVAVHVNVNPAPRMYLSVPVSRNAEPLVLTNGPRVPRLPEIWLALENTADPVDVPSNSHVKSLLASVLYLVN